MASKGRYRGPRAARRTGANVKPYSGRLNKCDHCGGKTRAPRTAHGRFCWDRKACDERAIPYQAELKRKRQEREDAELKKTKYFGELLERAPGKTSDERIRWARQKLAEAYGE